MAPYLLSIGDHKAINLDSANGPPSECLLDYTTMADSMKEAGKDIMGMIPPQVCVSIVFELLYETQFEIKFTESAGPVYCQSAILVGRFFVASSVVVNGLEQRQP